MSQPEDNARLTATTDSPTAEPIPTYMSQAVLATLLCFPFTGAMAIVYASQVSTKLEAGDLDGASIASKGREDDLVVDDPGRSDDRPDDLRRLGAHLVFGVPLEI